MLPIWESPWGQCVPDQSATNVAALVAHGVPDAAEAYELTPGGAKSIHHKRVPGGVRVTMDEFGLTTQILLAEAPSIYSEVSSRAAEVGPRSAQLQRDLALTKYWTVQATATKLASHSRVKSAATWLETARKDIQTCDGQRAAGDVAGAALNAQRAMRLLRLIERSFWDDAVEGIHHDPLTSPAAMSFDTLPSHWRLRDRLHRLSLGPNRLPCGDCENLNLMLQSGWRQYLHSTPTVLTTVEVLKLAALSGQNGLRLAVVPTNPKKPPAVIETPPIMFTSPAVQVEAGQIVCIHGWVNVPKEITASSDGLLIVDSLSGEALAERINKTDDWKEFALYRGDAVGPDGRHLCALGAGRGMDRRRDDPGV